MKVFGVDHIHSFINELPNEREIGKTSELTESFYEKS